MTALNFEIIFSSTAGLTYPAIKIYNNKTLVGDYILDNQNTTVNFTIDSTQHNESSNNLIIHYYNKVESETIVVDNKIVRDQSLTLHTVYIDGILIEDWFITDNYYYPNYFDGYLRQAVTAPDKCKSQLKWHFPGKFIIADLPSYDDFWSWYQSQRQKRILQSLYDPSGQVLNNLRGITLEDKQLIAEIKGMLNV